jgi:hypothetical protein
MLNEPQIYLVPIFWGTENSFIFTKTENTAKALYQTETIFKKLFVKTICFQITLKWGFLKLFFYNLRKTYPWKKFQKMLPNRPVNFNRFSMSDKSNTIILKIELHF